MSFQQNVFEFKPFQVVHKWGTAHVLFQKDGHCTKMLNFFPGESTSFHYHLKRVERLYVVSGDFIVRTTDPYSGTLIERRLAPTYIYEIPAGLQHQIQCINGSGKILETSEYYLEEDVMRIIDTVNGSKFGIAEDQLDRAYPGGPSLR